MNYRPKHLKLPPKGVLTKNEAKGISPYVFTDTMAIAIDVALVTNRPLLVSGDPGCGKSRLADAIAQLQGWSLLSRTITSRTRLEGLTAEVDQLRRLNDAQAARLVTMQRAPAQVGWNKRSGSTNRPLNRPQGRAAQKSAEPPDGIYLNPGIFWWAFDPDSARRRGLTLDEAQAHGVDLDYPGIRRQPPKGKPAGTLLLIDEIDKAEPDLPNDLLEPLDRRRFDLPDGFRAHCDFGAGDGKQPAHACIQAPAAEKLQLLTLITTNGERELPQAFLRRCVLLDIDDPDQDRLVDIASQHFPNGNQERIQAVAKLLVKLRQQARDLNVRPPGTAELLDAVRACEGLEVEISDATDSVWSHITRAVLAKDPAL